MISGSGIGAPDVPGTKAVGRGGQIAGRQLERLREDRHLCAHPAFSAEALLFEPTPELVRMHLVNAVDLGVGDVKTDYAAILAKAPDSVALVSEVNLLLAAGQLSDATVQTIRSAVDSIAASDAKGPINRVGVAILLTVASPEFMVVR